MTAPWHALSTCVQADKKSAFESTHDKEIWSFLAANPDHSKIVDDAVASDARLVMPMVIDRCHEMFDGVETVVDVGRGNGTAMGILVKACPWIKAVNFDLPNVVGVAPDSGGVEHVEGDIFVNVPKAGVAFLLWLLHDWGDECIKILKKCKEAIPRDKGKVIIVDAIIVDDDNNNNNNNNNDNGEKDELKCVKLMFDMMMLTHSRNGKERTLKEWDYVLTQAGFNRHIIKHIEAVQSVIVAFS